MWNVSNFVGPTLKVSHKMYSIDSQKMVLLSSRSPPNPQGLPLTPLKKKYMPESEQPEAVLEKNKEILQDKQLPISLKKQVMDQCILPTMTYGCQTWSLNKQLTNKLRTAQRAMERKMLDLKLKIRYYARKSEKEQRSSIS